LGKGTMRGIEIADLVPLKRGGGDLTTDSGRKLELRPAGTDDKKISIKLAAAGEPSKKAKCAPGEATAARCPTSKGEFTIRQTYSNIRNRGKEPLL